MSKQNDKSPKKPFPLKEFLRLFLVFLFLFLLGKFLYNYIFSQTNDAIQTNNAQSAEFIAHQQKIWDSISVTLTPLYTPVHFNKKSAISLPSALQIRTEDIKLNFNQGFHWTLRDLPQRPSLDLICVVDTSGSMSGDKIAFVKQSLIEMIEFLADGDRLSIITFNTAPTTIVTLSKVEGNRKQLVSSINSLFAGGGTDIYKGMYQAMSQLAQRTTKADITSVFLLTDGQDNFSQGQQLLDKVNSINLNKEFSSNIHTFSYGSDHDSFFLSNFAKKNGGEYYYIEDIKSIRKYFINAFGQILSIAFQSIEIILSTDQNSQRILGENFFIKETFGDMWRQGDNKNMVAIEINQFQYGVTKDFVIELSIPFIEDAQIEAINNFPLFNIDVQASINQRKFYKRFPINFLFAKSSVQINDKTSLNEQVLIHYYRMKLVQIFEQAQSFLVKGLQKESKSLLEEFKQQLEIIYKERILTDIKEMIDEIDKAILKSSEQGAEHYFQKESQRRAYQKFHPDSLKGSSALLNSLQEYMDEL